MTALEITIEWIEAARVRYEHMHRAGVDEDGYANILKMYDYIQQHQQITVGHAQYIFDRTHRLGRYPRYNTFRRYNRRYGELRVCNLQALCDSEIVRWATGTTCIQPNFRLAIEMDTDYQYRLGRLIKQTKKNLVFDQVFRSNTEYKTK